MIKTVTAPQVGMISLGCPKALVDTEGILTQLRVEGYEISPRYETADVVVINTCGFIESAVDESLEAIGEALQKQGHVIVTGCLGSQADKIYAQHPGVLAVTGPHDTEGVMRAIREVLPLSHDPFVSLVPPQGIKLTPRHYAYLKISEGCNHRCTFCIIPSLRGDLVSRPMHDVLEEAQRLVDSGRKELLVISQDTSAYGVDLRYRPGFWQGKPLKTNIQTLAQELGTLGAWVRLHYVYPYPHVDHLIPLMSEGLLAPYLDVPFQHASPRILKAMKRPGDVERTLERVHAWRRQCPDLSIRSTFIVGFPGETHHDFEQLLNFLEEAELDRVGCFAYSAIAGAVANQLADPVPEPVKLERQAELMQRQEKISRRRLRRFVGKTLEVILDARDSAQIVVGRTIYDAPEIDGVVRVRDTGRGVIGERCQVHITGSDVHDLEGTLL